MNEFKLIAEIQGVQMGALMELIDIVRSTLPQEKQYKIDLLKDALEQSMKSLQKRPK